MKVSHENRIVYACPRIVYCDYPKHQLSMNVNNSRNTYTIYSQICLLLLPPSGNGNQMPSSEVRLKRGEEPSKNVGNWIENIEDPFPQIRKSY